MIRKFFIKRPDPLSGLTHFIGALFAVLALVTLLTRNSLPVTVWHIVGFSIFGCAMILLYSASTLYHWLPVSQPTREIFRKIDHIMIFVFIAASYTPVCLVTLRGGWGWSIFGVVWGLTIAGLFLKIFKMDAPRYISTGIYLLMGWLMLIGIYPLIKSIDIYGLGWLAFGGGFYSIGAIIYAVKKPNIFPGIFGFHELFHLFVMMGSFCHFIMLYRYV